MLYSILDQKGLLHGFNDFIELDLENFNAP